LDLLSAIDEAVGCRLVPKQDSVYVAIGTRFSTLAFTTRESEGTTVRCEPKV